MDLLIFQKLGIAIALGGLIGIERERKLQINGRSSFGGVRTFALVGLLGSLIYILFADSILAFSTFTLGFLLLIIANYLVSIFKLKEFGATSEIAAVIVYLLGVMSARGEFLLATFLAMAVVGILHFKEPLHGWVKNISDKEMVSSLQFLFIAFVILPLLPNEAFGPYEFFNPYLTWLMVVFISGISFVSYIAIKLFGSRNGICLTGFLAGLISSTALTLSYAPLSRKSKGISNSFVVAVVIAGSAMFFRVLVEVFALNPDLLAYLFWPIFVMGAVGVLLSLYLFTRSGSKNKKDKSRNVSDVVDFESPFSLKPAIKFALLFALIVLVAKFALTEFGDSGIYLTSLFFGLIDVDALTVLLSNLSSEGELSMKIAANGIFIATVVNTFSKAGIFLIFGNRRVALKILSVYLVMIFAGGISLFFL